MSSKKRGAFAACVLAIWHAPGRIWVGALRAAPIQEWWKAGGQMALTAFAGAIVLILWLGPWTLDVETKRVDWLGGLAVLALVGVMVYAVAATNMRLNLRAGRGGIEANMAGDDDPAPPAATITTTTEVQLEDGRLPPHERVEPGR